MPKTEENQVASIPAVTPLAPVEPQEVKQRSIIPLPKIVTKISTGERWAVQGGYNWDWIAENVCNSEVSGQQLYNCATGKRTRAGGYKIELA